MGEMADALLLTSCRAVPARLQAEQFEFRFPNFSNFLEDHFNS
jgi:NAD dependent epimerase/dehydratase family enzyme